MMPANTFLVFGPTMPPAVILLSDAQVTSWHEGTRIAAGTSDPALYTAQVYDQTFGKGARLAIPAWRPEGLELMATRYEGPHKARVRYVAAALRMGKPIEPEGGEPKPPKSGGETVPVTPVKPKGGSPARVARDRQDKLTQLGHVLTGARS